MPTSAFSYAAFWSRAARHADSTPRGSDDATASLLSLPCPKVYVYDQLRPPLSDLTGAPLTLDSVFGPAAGFDGQLRATNEFTLAKILLFRLLRSEACRTTDPARADVFFAPILPEPKTHGKWVERCKRFDAHAVRAALVHLNERTACRHFFVVSKGHYVARQCHGWFADPNASSLFERTIRLAYSFPMAHASGSGAEFLGRYPNLHSVPYPSVVHWRRPSGGGGGGGGGGDGASRGNLSAGEGGKGGRPGGAVGTRPLLMIFLGRTDHGDVHVRRASSDVRPGLTNQLGSHLFRDTIVKAKPSTLNPKPRYLNPEP